MTAIIDDSRINGNSDDYIDNSKKTGSTIRAPLAENKKLFNQNQTSTLKTKKSTGIKTVINKNQGTGSRLTT